MTTRDVSSKETCGCNRCDCADCNFGVESRENRLVDGTLRSQPAAHAGFKRAMQLRGSELPALMGHTSQDDDSGVNALFDAAAVMLDITSFYDQVTLNEGFLNTAKQRMSVLELARSIGYELGPGVAASTQLSLEIQTAPGLDEWIKVPAGVQVQSIPSGGEQPQTFETVEEITGHTAWNSLPARLYREQDWTAAKDEIFVEGKRLGLAVGGMLVLVFPGVATPEPLEIRDIEEDFEREITSIKLSKPLGKDFAGQPTIYAFSEETAVFGANAPDWRSLPASAKREYLGLAEGDEIPTADRFEWPNFTIHLPGTTPARFPIDEAVLEYTMEHPFPAEMIVQQVKSSMSNFTQVNEQALSARMSNATFGTVRTGITSADAVGKVIRTSVETLNSALSDFATNVDTGAITDDIADQAIMVMDSALRTLADVFKFIPIPTDPSSVAPSIGSTNFKDALGELIKQVTTINPVNAIQTALEDIAEEMSGLSDSSAATTLTSAAESIVNSATEYGELADSATRVALVKQAESVVGAALDMALQTTPPEGFSRRGFVTFVAATLSNVLVLPNKFSPTGDAFVDMLSGNIDTSNAQDLLEPDIYEDFNPDAFRNATPDGVTDTDLVLASVAIGAYPQVVVPYAALASMIQLANHTGQSILQEESIQPVLMQYLGQEPDLEEVAQWTPLEQAAVETRDVVLNALHAPQTQAMVMEPNFAQYLYPPSFRSDTVSLDGEYRDIVAGPEAKVFLDGPKHRKLLDVEGVETVSRSDFALSGKSTVITADSAELADVRTFVRTLTVHGGSFLLELAPQEDSGPISGDTFEIPTRTEFPVGSGTFIDVPELKEDQAVIVTGTTTSGDPHAQYARIKSAEYLGSLGSWEEPHWRIVLDRDLSEALERKSVGLFGNIALATHGQAHAEILNPKRTAGGYVTFSPIGVPVTHVSSATEPGGAKSTMEIEVDGETWARVGNFLDRDDREKVYTERMQDDGTTELSFIAGSYLPLLKNLQASYRIGLGAHGNLAAERLSNLLSRPLGLVGAQQPIAATGGEDPESLENARSNAPLSVKTLDRLVSLEDYEDYANAFAGISKAQSAWAWFGQVQGVLLTVAGANGDAVAIGSKLANNLRDSIDNYRDPAVPVQVVSYDDRPFGLALRIYMDEKRDSETVRAAAEELLKESFNFDRGKLAHAVLGSDIYALLHDIDGVLGVDLDALYFADKAATHASRLPARAGRINNQGVPLGAQLLTLDHAKLSVSVIAVSAEASVVGSDS